MFENKNIKNLMEKWEEFNYNPACFSENDKNLISEYIIERKKHIMNKLNNPSGIDRNKFFTLMDEIEELNQIFKDIEW